jgi:hypothetical protein
MTTLLSHSALRAELRIVRSALAADISGASLPESWVTVADCPTGAVVVVIWSLGLYSTLACGEYATAGVIELAGAGVCEQPFGLPIGTSSLAQFWARGWHPALASLLRSCVYEPVSRAVLSRGGAAKPLSQATGILCTFLVSGALHAGVAAFCLQSSWRLQPLYFGIQGVAVIVERAVFARTRGFNAIHRLCVFGWLVVTAPLFMAAYEAPGVSVLDRIAVSIWGLYV